VVKRKFQDDIKKNRHRSLINKPKKSVADLSTNRAKSADEESFMAVNHPGENKRL